MTEKPAKEEYVYYIGKIRFIVTAQSAVKSGCAEFVVFA